MTKEITVANSDSTIWHRDTVVADLTEAMLAQKPFTINLNGEGPCASALELYTLLDNLCDRYRFDKNSISVHTWNQIEHHSDYRIVKHPPIKGVSVLQNQQHSVRTKEINKHTKHFANFVSRGNSLRLIIASELYFAHRDKTLQSYHTDVKHHYFNHHIGLEDVLKRIDSEQYQDHCYNLLKCSPITVDHVQRYPILHGPKVYEIIDHYDTVFVDIVNLAYFTGNTFYIDEKLWRPIVTKTPFIVQGPQNFLSNLKRLGFQTFDRWWDEGYSEDPADHQVVGIIENIREISQWPIDKISEVYKAMTPVLEHNYDRFLSLTVNDFKKVFDYV